MKLFASIFLSLFLIFQQSFSQPVIVRQASGLAGTAFIDKTGSEVTPVELPAATIEIKTNAPVFVGQGNKDKCQDQTLEIIKTFNAASILLNKEYSCFVVDTKNKTVDFKGPNFKLSDESVQALDQAPLWIVPQLNLKLRLLSNYNLDKDYSRLILDAPENQKDEVAFLIANLSLQSLLDTRFSTTKDMISKTAEFIYNVDDSLRYVDLVEHGSYAARDYYTTTRYRIYDPDKKDTVWSEIPREIYYYYIVHPKLDQEGVYVRDNNNDASGQRTYGYDWRNFIWNNPDPAHDYTKVNKTTTKGSIKTIPLFSELLKKPEILWKREKTYLTFNRQFKDDDYALDIIGNWCSRALPVDVTLPRAFQPNQILIKHDGNCNEDAFLVAAACRTALIPLVYLGTWSMDHVFGAFWDQDWNHYEFFRGGLAPAGNQFYGITNMLDGGSYGWDNARVEGFRPDGYPENFTKYYANTCTFNVSVTDLAGNPVDGAMLVLHAGPSAYSSSPAECGRVWTDFSGNAEIVAGEKKSYLIQVYHPAYGWNPADSTQAFYLSAAATKAGQEIKALLPYTVVKTPALDVASTPLPESGKFGITAKWKVTDVLTGVNSRDWQKSRFYKWNDGNKGEVSFFVCDSNNYEKFRAKTHFEAYEYYDLTCGGDATLPLPAEGKWYVVFSNHNATNFFQSLEAEVSLVDNAVKSGVEDDADNSHGLGLSPNPASDRVNAAYSLSSAAEVRISLCNSLGMVEKVLAVGYHYPGSYNISFDVRGLAPGVYFLRLQSDGKTTTRKLNVNG